MINLSIWIRCIREGNAEVMIEALQVVLVREPFFAFFQISNYGSKGHFLCCFSCHFNYNKEKRFLMKVLVTKEVNSSGIDFMKKHGIEVVQASNYDVDTLKKEVVDCDGLLVRAEPIPSEVLACGKKLKVIGRHGVGYNNIDIAYATTHGIKVTNAPLSNYHSVAEHTLGFILACSQKILVQDAAVRRGEWDSATMENKMIELSGKVLTLIGFGRIGREVARMAQAGFNMKIVAYSPSLRQENAPQGVTVVSSVEEAMRCGDFVSLHLPANKSTDKMFDYPLLSLMKKSAYLINCARGEIINFDDFIRIMKEKKISGAAFDLLDEAPPRMDNPLLQLDNLIVSPHCAAHSIEAFRNMSLHAAQGIVDVLEGREPEWPVN